VTASPGESVHAGDLVTLTGTVKNTGTGTAWRVQARVHADDPYFDDYELVFGKLNPGESKSFSQRVQLPKDAVDRVDQLTVDVKEARNAPALVQPLNLKIGASPRPTFAFGYDLIDDGNGDGLVQKGEKFRLKVSFKNAGVGTAAETTALLRNDSGDGLVLGKSRFELGKLDPGASKDTEFTFEVGDAIKGPNVIVELAVYDAVLGTQETEKLTFPLHDAGPAVAPASGTVEAKKKLEVRIGADNDAGVIATANAGARLKLLGTVGTWTKVEVAGKPGFVLSASVSKRDGAPGGAVAERWQVTPPTITLANSTLQVQSGTYSLSGAVSDDSHVEDVYVFVSNQGAKIDGRKVFYKSNRGAKDARRMDFDADIPVWAGNNQITLVVRENEEVKTIQTLYVYRTDGQKTAAAPAPAAP
jgi:carboxyl-terminal processing protease